VNKRLNLLIVAAFATAILIATITGCGAAPAASTTTDGQALVTEQCGRCHPLERVSGVTKDQAGWTATVARMRTNGLTVTDEQAAAIVKYLTDRDAAK